MRWTNTNNFQNYLDGKWKDETSVQELNEKDILIESFFLKLRTSTGIEDISLYKDCLIPDYELLITNLKEF